MELFKSAFAAAAASLLLSGVAMADVSTQGQSDPSEFTINGSIEKYINFVNIDTHIDMLDLGSPLNGASYEGAWTGDQPNAAQITFDSNSHVRLDIGAYADLSTTDGNGIVDTLPTSMHLNIKGRAVTGGYLSTNNNASWNTYNHYGNTAPLSFEFGHGPGSGIDLTLIAVRNGLNDHAGTYTTTIPLTWSDLG